MAPQPLSKSIVGAYIALGCIWCIPYFINVNVSVNLLLTVVLIIYLGCHRSLKLRDSSIVKPGEVDVMSSEDAMKFPIVGSVVLFSLFLVLKFIPKDLVNLVLSFYFSGIGAFSLFEMIHPLAQFTLPTSWSSNKDGRVYKIPVVAPDGFKISFIDVLCFILVVPVAVLYFKTKYWMLNNIIGIAIAIQGIEMVSLGSFKVGAILLSGLFFYDIFWVFGTDKMMTESVMVVVAKGLEAPIKLVFPRVAKTVVDAVVDVAKTTEAVQSAKNIAVEAVVDAVKEVVKTTSKPEVFNFAGEKLEFSMLGLGDIVIPGFLIALLLRFDAKNADATPEHGAHGQFKKPYFHSNLVAYFFGLLLTITMMTYFEAAQPALLYLVPACLGGALLTAAFRGEISLLFNYDESEQEGKEASESDISDKKKN